MPLSDLEAQIAEIRTALVDRCERLGAMVADAVWHHVDFYAASGRISHDTP